MSIKNSIGNRTFKSAIADTSYIFIGESNQSHAKNRDINYSALADGFEPTNA